MSFYDYTFGLCIPPLYSRCSAYESCLEAATWRIDQLIKSAQSKIFFPYRTQFQIIGHHRQASWSNRGVGPPVSVSLPPPPPAPRHYCESARGSSHTCVCSNRQPANLKYMYSALLLHSLFRRYPRMPPPTPTGLTNVIHVSNLLLSSSMWYCIVSWKYFKHTEASKIYFSFFGMQQSV